MLLLRGVHRAVSNAAPRLETVRGYFSLSPISASHERHHHQTSTHHTHSHAHHRGHHGASTASAAAAASTSVNQESSDHERDASASTSADLASPVPPPPRRTSVPSYLYRPFMGSSNHFAAMPTALTRSDLTDLEREPLSHVAPGRVNDHICIGMAKTLRWMADRTFRERYIHRATMLVTVASAAPAAGAVAAYLRMFFKRQPTDTKVGSSLRPRTSTAAEVPSPFLAEVRRKERSVPLINGRAFLHISTSTAAPAASLRHSYAAELRGLLSQSESHAVHYQILSSMAEINSLERGLVLALQASHFLVFLALFLFYPRMGFRLLAYTAEESSVVWTQMVNDVDLGKIAELHVPELAVQYWGLDGHFTAQGALAPMLVAPATTEVVLFKTEEIASAAEGDLEEGTAPAAQDVVKKTISTEEGRTTINTEATASFTKEHEQKEEKPNGVNCDAGDEGGHPERPTPAAPGKDAHLKRYRADPGESVLTLRDVVLLIRSDEMVFRDLNHEMADELDTQPGYIQRMVNAYEQRRQDRE